jgi:DNA-binding NarL/FixJ family response regulator
MARLRCATEMGERSVSGVIPEDILRGIRRPLDGAPTISLSSDLGNHPLPGPVSWVSPTDCPPMAHRDPRAPSNGVVREQLSASRSHTYDPDGRTAPSTRLISQNGHLPGVVEFSHQRPDAKILILDGCTLQRENLAAVFAANGNSVPAVAWDVQSLRASADVATPDIVLLNMLSGENVTLLNSLRETCPHAKVIVVGISEDDESEVVACAEAGVAGYHLRTESLSDLFDLISKVYDGESLCSPKVSAILLKRLSALAAQRQPEARELVLTAREIQILRMLEIGLSNRDIAERLCIALHTVKNHVHSVLGKLGVSTRAQAVAVSRSFQYTELNAKDLGTELV